MEIQLKRVYDQVEASDGFRVLVDALWPRGISKQRAQLDLWAKDVAPSAELRTAFHHAGMPWDEFSAAYLKELRNNPATAALRTSLNGHPVVTLLFGAHDEQHNNAVVLAGVLVLKPA